MPKIGFVNNKGRVFWSCSTNSLSEIKLSVVMMLNISITVPFNNMRALKFRAQLTNACFTTVNQMFDGSSQLQPSTTAEHAVIKSLCTVQTTKQCLAAVWSWEELPNIWLTVAKNSYVGGALNFRVRMLLKGSARVRHQENWPAVRVVLLPWFGYLEEVFLLKRFNLKIFPLLWKLVAFLKTLIQTLSYLKETSPSVMNINSI